MWTRLPSASTLRRVLRLVDVADLESRCALAQASAGDLERYWRGHWAIENQVHYVRDRAFQEDASQVAQGNAPLALAALRNGVLNHFRLAGYTNIAATLRKVGAQISRALDFVGLRL